MFVLVLGLDAKFDDDDEDEDERGPPDWSLIQQFTKLRWQIRRCSIPKVHDSVERHVVRIMLVVRSALRIVERRAYDGHDIAGIKLPVRVLESVKNGFQMIQHDRPDIPVCKIRRTD